MQSSYAGPLAAYNSLTDSHLVEYYSNPRRRKHLRLMGLITRDGRIVEESEVRTAAARKEHQCHTKELLASTIVSKAIEMERKQVAEMRQKLELLAKFEVVERVKNQRKHPDGTQQFNPFHSSTPPPPPYLSTSLHTHHDKLSLSLTDFHHFSKQAKRMSSHRPPSPYYKDKPSGTSTPVPRPLSSPKPRTPTSTIKPQSTLHKRSSVHSEVQITLCYVGRSLHLEGSVDTSHSEVTVLQQHCGGNTVRLYRGTVRPREHFTFTSRRHLGMPFGLTLYLDGTMDSRVSTCCEFRHKCGKMLGSKSSHFRLVKLNGGKPCSRCETKQEAASMLPQEECEPLSKHDGYKLTAVTEGVSSGERKELQSRSEILTRQLGLHQPHAHEASEGPSSSKAMPISQVMSPPSESVTKMKLKSKLGTSHGNSLSRMSQPEMHWGEDLTPIHKPSEVDPTANGKEDIEANSRMKFNSEELPGNSDQVVSSSKFASEVTKTISNEKRDVRELLELGNEASSSPLTSLDTLPTSPYPDISPPASHHLDNTLEKSHHSSLTSVSTSVSACAGSSTEES